MINFSKYTVLRYCKVMIIRGFSPTLPLNSLFTHTCTHTLQVQNYFVYQKYRTNNWSSRSHSSSVDIESKCAVFNGCSPLHFDIVVRIGVSRPESCCANWWWIGDGNGGAGCQVYDVLIYNDCLSTGTWTIHVVW